MSMIQRSIFKWLPTVFFFFKTKSWFLLLKKVAYLFCFLTLCLCLQHFHNVFLLLNKGSPLDPVTDTLGTHGTIIGPASWHASLVRQSQKDFGSHSTNPLQSAWAHATCRFRCFPNLLGVEVNNPVARGSRQPSFVRGCVVGKPTRVCQTLDHPECL